MAELNTKNKVSWKVGQSGTALFEVSLTLAKVCLSYSGKRTKIVHKCMQTTFLTQLMWCGELHDTRTPLSVCVWVCLQACCVLEPNALYQPLLTLFNLFTLLKRSRFYSPRNFRITLSLNKVYIVRRKYEERLFVHATFYAKYFRLIG